MENNCYKAYKEVIEILKYVPKESVEKIPQSMIETFKMKMDKEYEFKVDINKNFEEQELLLETKAIFANIFRDYWATPTQREKILAKEKYDRAKTEEEKREKYNPDNVFNNKQHEKIQEETEENNLPIEIKKERFFDKIICFFKRLFQIQSRL